MLTNIPRRHRFAATLVFLIDSIAGLLPAVRHEDAVLQPSDVGTSKALQFCAQTVDTPSND